MTKELRVLNQFQFNYTKRQFSDLSNEMLAYYEETKNKDYLELSKKILALKEETMLHFKLWK